MEIRDFLLFVTSFNTFFLDGPLCIYQSPLLEPEPLAECSVLAEGSANFVAEGSASAEG